MTWRKAQVVTLLMAASARPGPGQEAPAADRIVTGQVTYAGRIPAPVANPEAGTTRALLEVDRDGGLSDAVVWVEGVGAAADAGGDDDEPAVMDQRDFAFEPHVLAVRAGREVEFRNSDNANHGVSAASLEAANAFNVTTPPGGSHRHRFVASRRPVAIGCPIHAAMAGWIFVFDHPYFAVTDRAGRFRIGGVPPGRYRLEARHPTAGMKATREIVVERDRACTITIEFREADLRPGL